MMKIIVAVETLSAAVGFEQYSKLQWTHEHFTGTQKKNRKGEIL